MSLATTSSIVWCALRPLIAANMLRIMRGRLLLGSRDLRDGGRIDTRGAVDGEDGAALRLVDLLDDAGGGHALRSGVGDRAPDEAHGLAELEARGHLRVGRRHVRDLLERGEGGHLPHEVLVV